MGGGRWAVAVVPGVVVWPVTGRPMRGRLSLTTCRFEVGAVEGW